MAKEYGYWNLETTTELNDLDREHIASLIEQGFTNGEVCENEEDDETEATP